MVPGKPLTPRQLKRIERAVDLAERASGLQFCVYVGPAEGDLRAAAETMLAERCGLDRPAVTVLVSPPRRQFEIVPSPVAARRLPDFGSALAAAAMTASFGVGDIAGGVAEGVRLLAHYAGPGTETGPELPDLLLARPS